MGCSNSKVAAEVAALAEENRILAELRHKELEEMERVEQTLVANQKVITENQNVIKVMISEREQLCAVIEKQESAILRLQESEAARRRAEALAEAQEIMRKLRLEVEERNRVTLQMAIDLTTIFVSTARERVSEFKKEIPVQGRRFHHHYHRDGTVSEKPWVKVRTKRHHRGKIPNDNNNILPKDVKPLEIFEPVDIDVSKRDEYHSVYSPDKDVRTPQELMSNNTKKHYHRKIRCWTGSCVDDYSSDEDGKSPEDLLAFYGTTPGLWQETINDGHSSTHIDEDPIYQSKTDIFWSSSLKRYISSTPTSAATSYEREELSNLCRKVNTNQIAQVVRYRIEDGPLR